MRPGMWRWRSNYIRNTMAIGTVKFFNVAKGFGFIVPNEGGNDVFVHTLAVEMAGMTSLRKDQVLLFETERDAKGSVRACKLKPHSVERSPVVPTEISEVSAV